jgi:ubiquinone/menaquinone biosynthesis C-methylase UbiE
LRFDDDGSKILLKYANIIYQMSLSQFKEEELRILQAYSRRDGSGKARLYAWDRLDAAYMAYRIRVAWVRVFKEAGFRDLTALEVLDVGCGSGGWLRMLLEWGATPSQLHGLDLLEERIAKARALSPAGMDFKIGNACELDYPNQYFDLCTASTVFSSILNGAARLALAREMARVVRPGGWVAIFDFAISDPRNPDTVGLGKQEIRRLFPDLTLKRTIKLILPPPLLRLLPSGWLCLAHVLEALFPLICTHRLYLLHK